MAEAALAVEPRCIELGMQPVPGSTLPQSAVGAAFVIPMAADFDGHAQRTALDAGAQEAAGQEQGNAPAHVMGPVLGSALAPGPTDHTAHHCTDGSVQDLGAGVESRVGVLNPGPHRPEGPHQEGEGQSDPTHHFLR